jgi:oligopeptide/dipeptide ABC transporter ATP-binding protein
VETVLELMDVYKYFIRPSVPGAPRKRRTLKAVDGVSFSINRGTSFALAGESGSGKTTVSRLILSLEKPTKGSILFEGRDLSSLRKSETTWYRSQVRAVFQDAAGSLNPRMRIRDIVAEPVEIQRPHFRRTETDAKVAEILRLVGLSARVMTNYPHELSGGQKQRVAIARAMILNPSTVVLDEPVSALDVSIRAQILNLLADIQEELGLTYFVIAHDLATLGHVSTNIGIMYLGRVVEMGDTEEIFENPLHPYTKALFAAMPELEPGRLKTRPSLYGEIGSALDLPEGCRFRPRCAVATNECAAAEPELSRAAASHFVACHRAGGLSGVVRT